MTAERAVGVAVTWEQRWLGRGALLFGDETESLGSFLIGMSSTLLFCLFFSFFLFLVYLPVFLSSSYCFTVPFLWKFFTFRE
jgi:hypothetical protein